MDEAFRTKCRLAESIALFLKFFEIRVHQTKIFF